MAAYPYRTHAAPPRTDEASVLARRVARIAGGATGIVGALVAFVSLAERLGLYCPPSSTAPMLLLAAIAAAFTVYALARIVFGLARVSRPSDRLEAWSLALPLVAVMLIAPLVLHGVVWVGWNVFADHQRVEAAIASFSGWMSLSIILVGHAHVTLATFAAFYARRLHRLSDEALAKEDAAMRGAAHLCIAAAVAAVPGVILIGLPPALVLLTGGAFVPLTYAWARATTLRERRMISGDVPRDDVAQ